MALAMVTGMLAGCGGAKAGTGASSLEQSGRENRVSSQNGSQNEELQTGKNEVNKVNGSGNNSAANDPPVVENGSLTMGDIRISLEPEDEYTAWDEGSAVKIRLEDNGITIEGQGAKAQDGTVTIEKAGTYILSGSLSDGRVFVDAGDDDVVRLVFDGVSIHSEAFAPVDIKRAKKTIISLEEGTVNSLSDSPNFRYRDEEKEEPNAALFSKGDLTVNGSGTLKVDGTFNNGICSKDVLKIVGGTFEVAAANHGVKGNDALAVYGGQLKISAVGDGVKSDTLAAILGGDILVSGSEEGLEAESIVICGGTMDLTASDDGINASTDENNTPWIYFMGGEVTVRAEGDGIDSNGSIHMSGGKVTVYGPSKRGNGALDYDREFILTGGMLAAFGPGGMEQNVSSASSQVSVFVDFGEAQEAGTEVILRDQTGKELYRGIGEKGFKTAVISVPEMVTGAEYGLEAGDTKISFMPEETIVYVNKEGIQEAAAMNPGRGGPGGRGERTDGGREGGPEGRPEPPEGGEKRKGPESREEE